MLATPSYCTLVPLSTPPAQCRARAPQATTPPRLALHLPGFPAYVAVEIRIVLGNSRSTNKISQTVLNGEQISTRRKTKKSANASRHKNPHQVRQLHKQKQNNGNAAKEHLLTCSGTLAPRNDGSCVTHAPPGRGGRASNKAHHRLLRVPVLH